MARPGAEAQTLAFSSATEAWLWYMACHQARLDGARVAGLAAVGRPCEPGDIHRTVARLYRAKRLHPEHLRVLVRDGRSGLPPDPEHRDWGSWQEAITRLEAVLRRKGIVA